MSLTCTYILILLNSRPNKWLYQPPTAIKEVNICRFLATQSSRLEVRYLPVKSPGLGLRLGLKLALMGGNVLL